MSLIKGKNLYTRDRKKSVLFKVYPYKQLYPYKGVPYKWLILYLGMRYKDKYFVDTCLPMGCTYSCFLFQSISDAIAWMFERNNPDYKCFNYLDDFLILANSNDRCKLALDCFVAMLEFLGFPVSHEKTIPPWHSD